MRLTAIGGLTLVLAACGGSEAPMEQPRSHTRFTHIANVQLGIAEAWGVGDPGRQMPHGIDALGDRLRSSGSVDLAALITRPLVVVDFDVRTVTTLCGNDALVAARDWGADLADPTRVQAKCTASVSYANRFACVQDRPDVLQVIFEDPDQPRLLGAYVGGYPYPDVMRNGADSFLVNKFNAQLATATCP